MLCNRRTLGALATGAAVLAALSLPGSPADAAQVTGRWNVPSVDVGYTASTVTVTITNTGTTSWIDYPVPFRNPNVLHYIDDSCMHAVAPGALCAVTIGYTPAQVQQPFTDLLQLQFTDLAGHPIPSPGLPVSGADGK